MTYRKIRRTVFSIIKPATTTTRIRMATNITATNIMATNSDHIVTVRLNVIILGYFKGLTMETKRFRVKRKILPVVAATTRFVIVVKMLITG